MSSRETIIYFHLIPFLFLFAVLVASCVLFHRAISDKNIPFEIQNNNDFSEAYSVLKSYYEDLRMPPIKDIIMQSMDDLISCPSDSYQKEVLLTFPKIESGCLCGNEFFPADPCLHRQNCFPIPSQMKAPFENFRKSKFCILRYDEDEYRWTIPGVLFCEPRNDFVRWGLSLCLNSSFSTKGNHIFNGVTQGTEGIDFDQNAGLHKVKFMMVNQANAGLFDVIGLIVGIGRTKPCSSPNKVGYTANYYPPFKQFFGGCGKYGSKEYVEPLDAQLENDRLQRLKEFFASNNWFMDSKSYLSDSPPNFHSFFTNTEQITLYQIRRPPEGTDAICRSVKEKDFKIKMNVMNDVDYIYNLCLTNIILCSVGILLLPYSAYEVINSKTVVAYSLIKIMCFSIAILCFLQAGLYWKTEIEEDNEEQSVFIKQLISMKCFIDPVDPFNNFKLKNVLKAAQDLASIPSNYYNSGILFLVIWSIIWFIVFFMECFFFFIAFEAYR